MATSADAHEYRKDDFHRIAAEDKDMTMLALLASCIAVRRHAVDIISACRIIPAPIAIMRCVSAFVSYRSHYLALSTNRRRR